MSNPQPPKWASWLLTRFVSNEALIGDPAEKFRTSHSSAWYWRQVLSAVIRASVTAVGTHKPNAIRAVAVGWTVLLLIFVFLGDRVANGLAYQIWGWTREIGY